jgi:hypothetical protein
MILRDILQINDNFEIVAHWETTQKIAINLLPNKVLKYQAFDQAIKKGFRSCGFYWMHKEDWDKGKRPNVEKSVRNIEVYAYKVNKELKKSEYNDPTIEVDIKDLDFVGKFKNTVYCGIYLEISVSNIRCVLCKLNKRLHKGYFFSYSPLNLGEEETNFLIPDERKIRAYRRTQKKYLSNTNPKQLV